jgi:hypothetical protein
VGARLQIQHSCVPQTVGGGRGEEDAEDSRDEKKGKYTENLTQGFSECGSQSTSLRITPELAKNTNCQGQWGPSESALWWGRMLFSQALMQIPAMLWFENH